MHEESDLIQACAQSFGERVVVEQFRLVVRAQRDPVLKQTLFSLLALYALTAIEKDIAWYALLFVAFDFSFNMFMTFDS